QGSKPVLCRTPGERAPISCRATSERLEPLGRCAASSEEFPMDARETIRDVSLIQFGIGQPVPRSEDPRLLRGHGRYTDDVKLPNQAYAVMVRSRVAHGVLKGIDAAAARAMPGVLGVYTAADLTGFGTMKCLLPVKNRDGSPMHQPAYPAL